MTSGLNQAKLGAFILAAAALTPTAAFAQSDDDQWSGGYVGAQATGTSDSVDASAPLSINQVSNLFQNNRGLIVVPGFTSSFSSSEKKTAGTAGVFAGYQFSIGGLVLGVEGDFAPVRRSVTVSQTSSAPATALTPITSITARRDMQLNGQWSARVRLGYASKATLFYVTGGYAQTRGRVSSIDSFTNPGGVAATGVCGPANTPCAANFGPEGPVVTTAREAKSLTGWTAGAGIERKLGKSISLGLEYRRTDLGAKAFSLANQTTVNTGPTTVGDNGQPGQLGSVSTGPTRIKFKSDALSLRIAFHF